MLSIQMSIDDARNRPDFYSSVSSIVLTYIYQNCSNLLTFVWSIIITLFSTFSLLVAFVCQNNTARNTVVNGFLFRPLVNLAC